MFITTTALLTIASAEMSLDIASTREVIKSELNWLFGRKQLSEIKKNKI